jgi:hypothetical protein
MSIFENWNKRNYFQGENKSWKKREVTTTAVKLFLFYFYDQQHFIFIPFLYCVKESNKSGG